MNTKDFTYLLQHPEEIVTPMQTRQLEEILEEFPCFQAARSLHLRGLKGLNSFKYNNALKVTAAYTADREVLFEFITSKHFIQNTIADKLTGRTTTLVDTKTESEQVLPPEENTETVKKPEEIPLPLTQTEADTLLDPNLFKAKDQGDNEVQNPKESDGKPELSASEELHMGEPLPFTKKERYSFSEWLQLATFKPSEKHKKPSEDKEIDNIDSLIKVESLTTEENIRKQKFDLIDKFIAERPKIIPQKDAPKIAITTSVKLDKKELMTETLAKVYLEQKKFKNAIQAYKILSLKYPEKSGFFADRIKFVERLKADDA